MSLNANQSKLKDQFLKTHEPWTLAWQSVLELDPDYFSAYLKWRSSTQEHRHLPPKIQQLCFIAVASASTYLHEPSVRAHVSAALAEGATKEEILEVFQLTSTLGIHSCNIGVPLLMEVLQEAGIRKGPEPFDERREQLKAEFTKNRGYWHRFWEEILELDPDFFKGYVDYSSVPWHKGTLEPKIKELIYCAFDCAATHLYVPGLKLHMQNAVRYGATPQEIMEVLEIAAYLSFSAVTTGATILKEELARTKIEALT